MSHARLIGEWARTLEPEYRDKARKWPGSPFEYALSMPPVPVGAWGERLAKGWFDFLRYPVLPRANKEHDLIVGGKKVEVKTSLMWASGEFSFAQIRDQDYDLLFCLGIERFGAQAWVFEKEFVMDHWLKKGFFEPMHGGKKGTETAVLKFHPYERTPDWLLDHGGALEKCSEILERVFHNQPRQPSLLPQPELRWEDGEE